MNTGYFPKWKHSLECELGWYLKRADVKFSHDWTDDSVGFSLQRSSPFSESSHRFRLNISGRISGWEGLVAISLSDAFIWKEMQLMPNIHCLSFMYLWVWREVEFTPSPVLRVTDRKQLVPGRPLLFPSSSQSPPSRFHQLPPKLTRGRWGLSRQGTCGCHLMGEKQVEMKGSSRFCQSASRLLSITALTFRVCAGVCVRKSINNGPRVCVCVCVCVCVSMCILSHWPTGSECECVHMFVHQCRVCETMCVH